MAVNTISRISAELTTADNNVAVLKVMDGKRDTGIRIQDRRPDVIAAASNILDLKTRIERAKSDMVKKEVLEAIKAESPPILNVFTQAVNEPQSSYSEEVRAADAKSTWQMVFKKKDPQKDHKGTLRHARVARKYMIFPEKNKIMHRLNGDFTDLILLIGEDEQVEINEWTGQTGQSCLINSRGEISGLIQYVNKKSYDAALAEKKQLEEQIARLKGDSENLQEIEKKNLALEADLKDRDERIAKLEVEIEKLKAASSSAAIIEGSEKKVIKRDPPAKKKKKDKKQE